MSDYLSNLFGLSGRRALVTGAAGGNGLAIAEALLRAGAEVVMVDKNEKKLSTERLGKYFKGDKLCWRLWACDLTSDDEISCLLGPIDTGVGGPCCDKNGLPTIDILVNCAGVSLGDVWDETMRVNLEVPRKLIYALISGMVKRKRGSIINITSLNDQLAFEKNAPYMTSKAALGALTRSIALDYGRFGIRANNICPGYIKTSMTKASWDHPAKRERRQERTMLGRWGVPSDLAGAVVWLASDASAYVTGADIRVDGGWSAKGL